MTRPTDDKAPTSVIVLGGGIAGLAAADLLAKRGMQVVLLEGSEKLGGTHRSVEIGPYSFDIGSIFYEDGAALFKLAPDLPEKCPELIRKQRRILPTGKLQHYPLNPSDVLRWPKTKLLKALASLVAARIAMRGGSTLEDICVSRLGKVFFQDTGLRNYTIHFNGVPPSEIGERFYYERMRFVHDATKLSKMFNSALTALRGKPFRKPPKPLHVRPLEGYDVLFDAIKTQLLDQGVTIHTNARLKRISGTPGAMTVETEAGTFTSAAVVGAVPIEVLHQALFDAPSQLDSLDLLSLFVSADWLDPEVGNVLFNFHPDGAWKRATLYSRIYPEAPTDREFFTVEVTVPPDEQGDAEASFAAFSEHLTRLGIGRGFVLEGSNIMPAAYPIYRPDQPAQVAAALQRITEAGVLPVGRQGRFEYLPTSTGVIRRVGEELAQL